MPVRVRQTVDRAPERGILGAALVTMPDADFRLGGEHINHYIALVEDAAAPLTATRDLEVPEADGQGWTIDNRTSQPVTVNRSVVTIGVGEMALVYVDASGVHSGTLGGAGDRAVATMAPLASEAIPLTALTGVRRVLGAAAANDGGDSDAYWDGTGSLPAALSVSGDSSWRQPMGVVVMGGLIMSTILTLVIVPALFSLATGVEQWLGPKLRRTLLTYKPGDEDGSKVIDLRPGQIDHRPDEPQPAE